MPWTPAEMTIRLASDVEEGWVMNLGTGLPTGVARHVQGRGVLVQSENGIIGVGPPPPQGQQDPDLVDAGKNFITMIPGTAFMDSLISFSMMRAGYLDLSVMGAYQVAANGDLANFRLPGRKVAGIGGAADLCAGAQRVWILMTHVNKEGEPKLVGTCSYPLTAKGVVKRVYTDLGVLDVGPSGFTLRDLAPGTSFEELQAATGAPIQKTA